MKKLVIALAVLALCAGVASAKLQVENATEFTGPNRANTLYAYWDMSDVTGFVSIDETATAVAHFHVSNFTAGFDGSDYWYCGDPGITVDGGYGNSWDDRLEVPATDITGATYPVLTFAHYFDSEFNYDFTYVQAKQAGAYVDMNSGYNGLIAGGAWVDLGAYGFVMTGFDNPVEARFRFVSDGSYSDADGLYQSVGGAYAVDNVKIFDFYGGTVYFFDDVNSGGLCSPAIPGSAGDYWHLVNDVCSSNVIPSWWCGDDADTSLIPPGLMNTLIMPDADISAAVTCTVRFATHAEVPTVDNDYWVNWVTVDGATYQLSAYWGDFEQCGGFGTAGLDGYDISSLLPASVANYSITFNTTDNGCGPGAAGGAGINCDDTWFEGSTDPVSPVEESSWGSIKAMYR